MQFIQLLNISSGEDKVLAVLADSTGRVDVEIELNKKRNKQTFFKNITKPYLGAKKFVFISFLFLLI